MNKTVIPNSNIEIAAGGGEHTVTAGTPVSLPSVIADQLVSLGLATYAPGTTSAGGTTTSTTSTITLPDGAFLDGYSVVNGAVVFSASDGSTLAPLALSGAALTAAQAAQLSGALQSAQVLNSAGHIALPVDGALDTATIGSLTAAQVLALANSTAGSVSAVGSTASALSGSLSTLGTLANSDHGAITALGTMSATAQTELNGLLTGTFSALSGNPTLSGSTISFPHANGTTSSLILPASTGTLAVPASAPALYSDSSGGLHPVAFVSTHIVSSSGTVDLAPAVVTALGGVITSSSTAGSVTTLALANGSSLVITAPQGATGATGAASTVAGPAGPAGAASTVAGPQGVPGSLAAGSLINPARESTTYGGPSRLVSAIEADSFTAESWGATADGRSISAVINAATRYAVTAFTNDAGVQPYSAFVSYAASAQDDYHFFVANPSPANSAGGNTWNLATTLTTTGAGFASPAVCNEDQVYFYIPCDKGYYPSGGGTNDHVNLYQFFHAGMVISGGGLAAGSTIISTAPRTLRISPQASGFALASGTVLTVGPDMTQFAVGKQVFSPQGLVPLSNITAVSGTTITLGTHTAPGTASAPASVAVAQANAFVGSGVPINQGCYVYTPVPEANVTGQISMDTLAHWAADHYSGVNGARVIEYGVGIYQFSGPVYLVGGNLSVRGRSSNVTSFASNNQVQGSGLAPVFKIYPKNGANPTWENVHCTYYLGKYLTFLDFDGNGFMPPGPYDGNTNVNAYSLNQIGTAAVIVRGCSFQTNYPNGNGCLEMVNFEGVGYSFFEYNTCVGASVAGSRGLRYGRGTNIEIRHNLIYYCDVAIEQDNYFEHPIVEYTLLQNCGNAFTNRQASIGGFSSMFFGEFKGGDYYCSLPPYDIRDANEITILDYHGPCAANLGPSILLSGCLVAGISGYSKGVTVTNSDGSTSYSRAAVQLGNTMRDGVVTGCSAVRVVGFASDLTATTLLVDAGCNQITYANISHGNTLTAAVTDNSGSAVNLGGGAVPEVNKATCYSTTATLTTTSSQIPLTGYLDKTGIFSANNGAATIKVAGTYLLTGFMPAVDAGGTGAPAAGTQIGLQFTGSVVGAGPLQWTTAGAAHTTVQYNAVIPFAAGEVVTLSGQTSTGSVGMAAAHFTLLGIDLS